MERFAKIIVGVLGTLAFCGGLSFSLIMIIALITGNFDISISRKF